MDSQEVKVLLLVFGIILLIVIFTRRAIKKVQAEQAARIAASPPKPVPQKPKLTEEQYNRSWKSLGYMLLLVTAGNLYMVYTAVRAALFQGIWIYWIDAIFSLLAAAAAFFIWKQKRKTWVFAYFVLLIVPIFMFMSLQGAGFKESALIHLFPMVLLYLALRPIWSNMED